MYSDDDSSISDSGDEFELLNLVGVKRRHPIVDSENDTTMEDKDKGDDDDDDDDDDNCDNTNVSNGVTSERYRSKRHHSEPNEFSIPDIFVVEGERNSRIFNTDKQIEQDIKTIEEDQKHRLDQVAKQKRNIVVELNDNGGSDDSLKFTEKHNSRYIDLLLKAHYRFDISQYRHYYFYKKVVHSNINCSTDIRNVYLWRSFNRLSSMSKESLLAFVNEIITKESNVEKSRQISMNMIKSFEKEYIKLPQLSASDFEAFIHTIGGDGSLQQISKDHKITMVFKLRQYNNGSQLILLRLIIVYAIFMNSDIDSELLWDLMAKCFILTVADANLQHCLSEMLTFTRFGSQCLGKLNGDSNDNRLWSIMNRIVCTSYNDDSEIDEYKHRTIYNIVRLINLSYAGTTDTPPKLVCCLNEGYLGGPLDSNTVRRVMVAANTISIDNHHLILHRIMSLIWILDTGLYEQKEIRALVELSANVRDNVYHRLQRTFLGEVNSKTQNVVEVLVRCHIELSNLNNRLVREASLLPRDMFG